MERRNTKVSPCFASLRCLVVGHSTTRDRERSTELSFIRETKWTPTTWLTSLPLCLHSARIDNNNAKPPRVVWRTTVFLLSLRNIHATLLCFPTPKMIAIENPRKKEDTRFFRCLRNSIPFTEYQYSIIFFYFSFLPEIYACAFAIDTVVAFVEFSLLLFQEIWINAILINEIA